MCNVLCAHVLFTEYFPLSPIPQQRWKVYEPALVSYPRPDLVRKPPLSFLEEDSTESDLMMKAGDFGE